jgi:hypothetical protein
VEETLIVSRFLTQSNHVANGKPSWRAFDPPFDEERQRFETSLYALEHVAPDEALAIRATVEASRSRPVIARAAVTVGAIRTTPLDVTNDEPPPHHLVLVGWPGTRDEGKEKRKRYAMDIASHQECHLADDFR